MQRKMRLTHGLVFATLTASGGAALAQGLEVAPVLVQMPAGQLAATVTATNRSTHSIAVQLRPFAWDQDGGVDHLKPTDGLAVSPPITQIDAGATQTFRLVLRHPSDSSETAFRLLLDEIPPPAAPGFVAVALRLSLPVFAEPDTRAVTNLSWRIVADGPRTRLMAHNAGSQHARVIKPEIKVGGSSPIQVAATVNPYVLPGAERSWQVGVAGGLRPGMSVRLSALSDGGPIDVSVPVVDR